MHHLDTETILNILNNNPAGKDDGMLQHLSECSICHETASGWAGLLDGLYHPPIESAPASSVRLAVAIFKPGQGRTGALKETLACLISDSWTAVAGTGLRGDGQSRQVFMLADEFDLHIRFAYDDGGTDVQGQLLRRGAAWFESEFEVCLSDGRGGELESALANEFGEFSFNRIRADASTIVVRLADRSITCLIPEGKL